MLLEIFICTCVRVAPEMDIVLGVGPYPDRYIRTGISGQAHQPDIILAYRLCVCMLKLHVTCSNFDTTLFSNLVIMK